MPDIDNTDPDTEHTEEQDNNSGSIERTPGASPVTEEQQEPESTLDPMRCPFAPRTETMKQNLSRNTKRTQRYRSTAQSRLGDMTVGDIRYCFQQLRNAGDNLTPEMILYNGQCAGEFALQYLQETSSATKKRRKPASSSNNDDMGSQFGHGGSMIMELPSSQLGKGEDRRKRVKSNVLEF